MPDPTYYTLVLRFDGPAPSIRPRQDVLGGELVAIQFSHALDDLNRYEAALQSLASSRLSRDEMLETVDAALAPAGPRR